MVVFFNSTLTSPVLHMLEGSNFASWFGKQMRLLRVNFQNLQVQNLILLEVRRAYPATWEDRYLCAVQLGSAHEAESRQIYFLSDSCSLMTAPHLLCTSLFSCVAGHLCRSLCQDALSSSPSWARTLLLSVMKLWARNCRALLNLSLPCTEQISSEAEVYFEPNAGSKHK